MKKNKTSLFIVLGLIFIIGFSMLISNLTGKEEVKFNNITYSEYSSYFKEGSKGLVFIYVGQPGCGACEATEPILKELQDSENIVFNYYNVSELSNDKHEEFVKTSNSYNEGVYTPTLIATFNGKEVNSRVGGGSLEDLREFINDSKSKAKDE